MAAPGAQRAARPLLERLRAHPEHHAICVITGGAHGSLFTGELVQLREGGFLHRAWSDSQTVAPAFEAAARDLDLERELFALEGAAPPPDTGGRLVTLCVAAGERGLALELTRPLTTTPWIEHPAFRLYRAVWGWP